MLALPNADVQDSARLWEYTVLVSNAAASRPLGSCTATAGTARTSGAGQASPRSTCIAARKAVWGSGHAEDTHYVRVHMANLRKKVERDPSRPEPLLTEAGIGYSFRP